MKRKKKRKRRIGISFGLLLAAWLPLAGAGNAGAGNAGADNAGAGNPGARKEKPLESYAIVSGSVFEASGYALPGADVTLVPEAQSGSSPVKSKPIELVSDARGEFVVRVPPGPTQYSVTVRAKGFQSQRKSAGVTGQERVEVTFQLERESK
jgi:hypothetical protein